MIHNHASSLLILLRALQKPYSELLEKDTRGRMANHPQNIHQYALMEVKDFPKF
jgi:hypothetical protein